MGTHKLVCKRVEEKVKRTDERTDGPHRLVVGAITRSRWELIAKESFATDSDPVLQALQHGKKFTTLAIRDSSELIRRRFSNMLIDFM